MKLVIILKEDFIKILQNELSKIKIDLGNSTFTKYLNIDEASKYLKIPKNTLYNYTSLNKIKYFRIGKRLVFKLKELDEFIESNRVN